MNAALQAPLREIRASLRALYGSRLKGIYLFGSQARGNAGPDSDMDIMIVLDGEVNQFLEIGRCIAVLAPVEIESGYCISPVIVSERNFIAGEASIYHAIRKEGIPL